MTTRELVQAFRPKLPPDQVQSIAVRQFESTDPDDPDAPLRELPPLDIPATYCWRLDITGTSYWISQQNDAEMLTALKPAAEDEDPGEVVGTLTKVRLDGETLVYGPVEIREKQRQRLKA